MATTEITTPSTSGLDPSGQNQRQGRTTPGGGPQAPVVLLELQDKLSRSRVREAFWISVMVHLMVIIAIATAPKWVPGGRVTLLVPSEMLKNQDQTFLALPPDLEKPTVKPKTNTLSDKDRIAMSRHPVLDHKELQKIIDASRPGRPGPPPREMASVAPSAPPMPAQPNAGQQQRGSAAPQFHAQNQQPRLESIPSSTPKPSANNPFTAALSPGSAIQQAARATVGSQGRSFGQGGDYGVGPRTNANVQGGLEVLSDTQGVDFGPYLQRVVFIVKQNWYNVIPVSAMPPILKKGKVSIEFAIGRDGRILGMRRTATSGDESLDRAAWSGITASNPFPPLPSKFTGPYLALRFHFFYNPGRGDLQ